MELVTVPIFVQLKMKFITIGFEKHNHMELLSTITSISMKSFVPGNEKQLITLIVSEIRLELVL